jgi:hypothetical protein
MREHAIIQKKVINLDHAGDRNVMCAWDICERDGYEMHKIRLRDSAPGVVPVKTITYVFCTERHKQYWINSTSKYGNLPPGYARSIL